MNKNILLLLLLTLCLESAALGQATSQRVEKKVAELRSSGVDLIVGYHVYHIGGARIYLSGQCQSDTTKYLFWSAGGKDFLQKFDECREYEQVNLKNSAFIKTARENLPTISKETIKHPEFTAWINGVRHTDSLRSKLDHPTISIFEFYTPRGAFRKVVNHYQMDYIGGPGNIAGVTAAFMNMHYEYNQRSTLKKLLELLETEPGLVSRIK